MKIIFKAAECSIVSAMKTKDEIVETIAPEIPERRMTR